MDEVPVTPPATQAATQAARKHFYELVVDNPASLTEAHELEGIDAEIDLLRVRLVEYLSQHPGDHAVLLKSIELIVRAVAARYRMSPQRAADLTASLAETLRQLGEQLFPQQVTDV